MKLDTGHGEISKNEAPFTQMLLPPRAGDYDVDMLAVLAASMAMAPDALSDGPDPEENLFMPAGYTYLGQFIDHDLTLDTTSTLNPNDLIDPNKPQNDPSNRRSPRFDLDCVYGNGPDDQPFMYATADAFADLLYKGASLLIGHHDLERAGNGRAIIGDKRNDENSIVNQIQQVFIRFHNKVVADLAAKHPDLRGGGLFRAAQREVRWAYQQIIMDDYLPRIIDSAVLDEFLAHKNYILYPKGPVRDNLPREFVAAAYRFGHSAVRTGYRLNGRAGPNNGTILPIFTNPPATSVDDSLVGFDPLPLAHELDNWGRFFPSDFPPAGERAMSNVGDTVDFDPSAGSFGDGALRLQYAYKLDPSIVDPLANLPPKIAGKEDVFPERLRVLPPQTPPRKSPEPAGPSLALLNLLRGNRYRLQGGQKYAAKLEIKLLDAKYLCVRQKVTDAAGNKSFTFTPIDPVLMTDTPLWFYILAEAQTPVIDYWIDNGSTNLTEAQLKGLDKEGHPFPEIKGPDVVKNAAVAKQQLLDTRCAGARLGPVGGRMVAEVFYGLLDSDSDSVVNRTSASELPIWGGGKATMAKLLRYVDPIRAPR